MKKDETMTKQNRKTVTDTIQIDIDYVSLETAIERLTNAMKDGFTQVELGVGGYYDSHSAILKVMKTREETDQEYEDRMHREQYYRDNRRREYERMKKEFGDA